MVRHVCHQVITHSNDRGRLWRIETHEGKQVDRAVSTGEVKPRNFFRRLLLGVEFINDVIGLIIP